MNYFRGRAAPKGSGQAGAPRRRKPLAVPALRRVLLLALHPAWPERAP